MMTREEARKHLHDDWYIENGRLYVDGDKKDAFLEATGMAITALRADQPEQVEMVINSLKLRLENNEENGVVSIPKFAVEQMIERLEVIKNG